MRSFRDVLRDSSLLLSQFGLSGKAPLCPPLAGCWSCCTALPQHSLFDISLGSCQASRAQPRCTEEPLAAAAFAACLGLRQALALSLCIKAAPRKEDFCSPLSAVSLHPGLTTA